MSRTAPKDRILACRLTDDEERAVDALAKAAGVTPARFLRNAVIEKLVEPAAPKRSWADEFALMAEMDMPEEQMERFNRLRNGRPLPKQFMDITRADQIIWL